MTPTVRLQREPFDAGAEAAKLARGRDDIGALVTFTGVCRGTENGEPIAALTLEHYPGMAEGEIERHVAEAVDRWPLLGVTVIHRFGRIEPGEDIVLVVTASSHRDAAFAAVGPVGIGCHCRDVSQDILHDKVYDEARAHSVPVVDSVDDATYPSAKGAQTAPAGSREGPSPLFDT